MNEPKPMTDRELNIRVARALGWKPWGDLALDGPLAFGVRSIFFVRPGESDIDFSDPHSGQGWLSYDDLLHEMRESEEDCQTYYNLPDFCNDPALALGLLDEHWGKLPRHGWSIGIGMLSGDPYCSLVNDAGSWCKVGTSLPAVIVAAFLAAKEAQNANA